MTSRCTNRTVIHACRAPLCAVLLALCSYPALAVTPPADNGNRPATPPVVPPAAAAMAVTATGTAAVLAQDWDVDSEQNSLTDWDDEEFSEANVDDEGRGPGNASSKAHPFVQVTPPRPIAPATSHRPDR